MIQSDSSWPKLVWVLFGSLLLRQVCCLILLAQTHGDLRFIRVASCSLILYLCPSWHMEDFSQDFSLISRDLGKQTHSFPSSLKDADGTVSVGTCLTGRENSGDGKSHPGLTSPCFFYPVLCLFSMYTLFFWHTEWCMTSQMHQGLLTLHMLLAALGMSFSSLFHVGSHWLIH